MTDREPDTGGAGTEDQDSPEVGSVAEEAAKLLGALQDWANESRADQVRTTARGMAEGLGSLGDHVGHGQDCRYCPLCRALQLVRETSPEVREHLAVAVGALAQAATAALRSSESEPGPHDRPKGAPDPVDLDD